MSEEKSSISVSPQSHSGLAEPAKSPRPSPGTPRLASCCETATPRMVKTSAIASKRWLSRRSSLHRGRHGRTPMSSASSARSAANVSITSASSTSVHLRRVLPSYITIAIAHGGRSGVTVSETHLKLVWDVIKAVKVGETGYACIVDGDGRLIAHRDVARVPADGPNLSALPQVAGRRWPGRPPEPVEGKTLGDKPGAASTVSSVYTVIPSLGWRVFVDLPAAETQASFWNAVIRGGRPFGAGAHDGPTGDLRRDAAPHTGPTRNGLAVGGPFHPFETMPGVAICRCALEAEHGTGTVGRT